MKDLLGELGHLGVVPVVKIERAGDAIGLGQALLEGGLPCAEITFRTAAAEEAIRRIASELPDVLVGAGTVLSQDQAEKAVAAGARFIVSPGFDPKVVDWCLEHSIPVTPGVATPTEINLALDKGLHILKFFPAQALGGVATLKAIGAPYGGVKFIPTGGVNASNLADYLSLPMVHACGGSWLVKANLISAGKFAEITQLTREAVALVHQVRG
jgi:2-dehydro-3-deoxyphosphogluconate aldolase/(4S)-4-hydroxy-2-oxoglutarate aldolase